MQTTFALAALAAVAFAAPSPQGVTGDITPPGAPPAGFSESYDGKFEITVVNSTFVKRSLLPRASTCGQSGYLTLSLAGGQLTDALGRTGYIAANYQFQFDAPPQTGALYTGGFSVGANGSLALGSSAVFYECLSGDFYNLYDRSWAAQCSPILIDIIPCGGSVAGGVGQQSDGQPTATTIGVVTQITDGQVQATTAIVVSEFTDGQPQVLTVVASAPVTQISDGQIQATTGTAPPVTQISDGQVQATATATATPITTATGAPVTQISDGQIQASATASPQNSTVIPATTTAGNSSKTSATPSASFTGGANMAAYSTFAATFVGLAAIILL